jgi:hypothetical protein
MLGYVSTFMNFGTVQEGESRRVYMVEAYRAGRLTQLQGTLENFAKVGWLTWSEIETHRS